MANYLTNEEKDLIYVDSIYVDDSEEYEWICYIRKGLFDIWTLENKYSNESTKNSEDLTYELSKDIGSFEWNTSFTSNEAAIWEVHRQITIGSINKCEKTLITMVKKLIAVEKESYLLFQGILKMLVFSAKVECYIELYFLLENNNSNEDRLGYKKEELFLSIIKSYSKLRRYADISCSIEFNPDHQEYPNNPFLIIKVITLIENHIFKTEDEVEKLLIKQHFDEQKIDELNTYLTDQHKQEKFSKRGKSDFNKSLDNEFLNTEGNEQCASINKWAKQFAY